MRNSRIQLGWTVTSLTVQPAQDMVASSHPRLHVGQPLNPSFNQRFLSLAAFFDRPPTRGQRPSEYRFLARKATTCCPLAIVSSGFINSHNQPYGFKSGEAHQVNNCFGMTRSFKDTARASAKRKHMAGPTEIRRLRL